MSGGRRDREEEEHPSGASKTGGLAAAIVGLHVLLGLLVYDPTLFPGGDNAGYMILGEALAEGRGYRDLYLPDQPLHTKYPPLYPALLALLGLFAGLQLFKLASLALTAAAVWLTYRLGRRLGGPIAGTLAALLLAVSPVLLDYSHYVLSEALFVVLVLASLLAAERSRGEPSASLDSSGGETEKLETPNGAGAVALALLAAAGAFLTRTAGLPLLAALVLYFALAREPRRIVATVSVTLVVAVGWWAYQKLAAPGGQGYVEEMLLIDPYNPDAGSAGLGGLAVRAAANSWSYLSQILPQSLMGLAPTTGTLAVVIGLVVAALAFGGWASRALGGLGPSELFAVAYIAMLALWPRVWSDQRFLLPLLPLLLIYAFRAASRLGSRIAARLAAGDHDGGRRTVQLRGSLIFALVLCALVGLPAVRSVAATIPERARCLADYRAGDPCDLPAFASFYAAARWASTATPQDAIVVNRKPRIFYWLSRRRGDLYRFSSDPIEVIESIESLRADFVVVDQVSATTSRFLVPAIREALSRFEAVYQAGEPPTLVLRFDPGARDAD